MNFHARHGLLIALIAALYTLMLHFSGLLSVPYLGVILALGGLLIPIVGIGWGIRTWREGFGQGYMTFGQGLKHGVLIVLWWGLASATFSVLYSTQINPGQMEQVMERQKALIESRNLPAEMTALFEKMMHFLMQPSVQFVFGVVGSCIWGTIIALVCAAILKRDPPPAEPPGLPGAA